MLVARGYCGKHQPDRESARLNQDVRQWYRSRRWRTARALMLVSHPRCDGYGTRIPCGARTVDVDHRVPHRGDPALFWDKANLQALCHRCHSAKTGTGQ